MSLGRRGVGAFSLTAALLATGVATLVTAPAAQAQPAAGAAPSPVDAGRQRAAACAVCHGQNGLAVTPDAPHLAGMPTVYFVAQLRAYRSGARRHEVMAVMARNLSDDDIQQLAAWYASIRLEATPPPAGGR
ncbi:MAG: c-type cytochrome [Rubrivivax sp.]|jgi:cytochrome c553|nr:c-type cytochrome [Rubrivivax sp.]